MPRWVLPLVAGLVVTFGLIWVGFRVSELEGGEVEHLGPWQRLEPSSGRLELTRLRLDAPTLVTVEVCALDSLDPERWVGAVELTVRRLDDGEAVLSLPLTERVLSYATRQDRLSCLLLLYDEPLTVGGQYAVEASWEGALRPEVVGTPMVARVMAHAGLGPLDVALVVVVLFGALLGVLGVVRWREGDLAPAAQPRRPLIRASAAVVALVAAATALSLAPLAGALGSLLQGVGVAAVQIALALALSGEDRSGALALSRPSRSMWLLWLAPIIGIGLWWLGKLASGLVPSTGVAPLQTFVTSPGGLLAVAAVAAAVPLAEELFFRGLLYGLVARRLGELTAAAVTVFLFVLAHLEQVWGAWGAVVSLVITAVVLTALRWRTGSVLAPALAHLAHNAVVVVFSLTVSAGPG